MESIDDSGGEVEEWKPVPGFDQVYQVSSLGRVRRICPGGGTHPYRLLRPLRNHHRGGYVYVTLTSGKGGPEGRRSPHLRHLVSAAFLGQCPPGYRVFHKNGDQADNRVSNLEYRPRGAGAEEYLEHYARLAALEADEVWKPVPGFEPFYHVSDLGRVRRVVKGKGTRPGRVRSPRPSADGYVRVVLYDEQSRRFTKLVHGLVAEAFLGPRPTPGHEVNHINCDRRDNRVSNLEYVTRQGNVDHAVRSGRIANGERVSAAKLQDVHIPVIRELLKMFPCWKIAELFGVTEMTIHGIKAGNTWRHIP